MAESIADELKLAAAKAMFDWCTRLCGMEATGEWEKQDDDMRAYWLEQAEAGLAAAAPLIAAAERERIEAVKRTTRESEWRRERDLYKEAER